MRMAIVAPGGVGGYFGGLLAQSGENVAALARGAHLGLPTPHHAALYAALKPHARGLPALG